MDYEKIYKDRVPSCNGRCARAEKDAVFGAREASFFPIDLEGKSIGGNKLLN